MALSEASYGFVRIHLEPFNGCQEMLALKPSEAEVKAEGSHRAVVTARFATGSVWSKTLVIPHTEANSTSR